MRVVIKSLVTLFLFLVVFAVTALPKLISLVWYCKWTIGDTDYFESIIDLVLTIVEDEEI